MVVVTVGGCASLPARVFQAPNAALRSASPRRGHADKIFELTSCGFQREAGPVFSPD